MHFALLRLMSATAFSNPCTFQLVCGIAWVVHPCAWWVQRHKYFYHYYRVFSQCIIHNVNLVGIKLMQSIKTEPRVVQMHAGADTWVLYQFSYTIPYPDASQKISSVVTPPKWVPFQCPSPVVVQHLPIQPRISNLQYCNILPCNLSSLEPECIISARGRPSQSIRQRSQTRLTHLSRS